MPINFLNDSQLLGSLSISGDGSNATVLSESGTGDFTIDAVGDITLDADGNDIRFSDGGTQYGKFKRDSGNFRIFSSENNKDLEFLGQDDGSTITALTLDMSDAGWAQFNTGISVGNSSATSTFSGKVSIGTIDEVGSDTDKFLMSDSGEVKYVTGANLRSYIGAGTGSGTVTGSGTTNYIPKWSSSTGLGNSNLQNTSTGAQMNFDGSGSGIGLDIHNSGTATGDDAQITFETQGSQDWVIGIDRSAAEFKLGRSDTLGTNTVFYADGSSNVGFAGTITMPSYIYHLSDPSDDTYFGFSGNDTFVVYTAGGKGIEIDSNRNIELPAYGSGSVTGTAAYNLQVDSSGNIIESAVTSGTVTSVTASTPLASSGGTTPNISISNATGTTVGAAALDAGTGISLSDSSGVYTVTNSGVTSIVAGTNVSVSGATGAVTVSSSDQYTGTVTSVELTGGEGVDVSVTSGANPITSTGNLTLTLDLDELTTTTGSGNADFFPIVNSSGAQYKIAPSDIDLSTMNNDSGWTTNTGTVTSVGITAGTGISVSGSPVTGSGSITVTNTAPATIDGSGAANQVAYWSDSDTLTGSNDLTYNGVTLALAGDNEVLQIGTGGTGTTSLFAWTGSTFYIQQDSASGAIQVETDNFLVKNHGAGETYIEATDGGSVDLYHNNVKTFETTATGATVTGDISITGGDITTNGVQTFSNSSSSDALLIGDTTGGDTISTIDLWVMGTSQAQIEDGAFKIQNNCTLQLDSGSDIALNGDANIRLDASIAANQSSGIVLPLGSTSVTVNNVYYWKSSSVWELTDADTEAKTNGLLAYANSSGTASSNRMVLQGIVFDSGHGFTIGAPLYIHTTAGALSNTAPSGTADCVRVVGYAITSDEIYFCPDNTWVKVS